MTEERVIELMTLWRAEPRHMSCQSIPSLGSISSLRAQISWCLAKGEADLVAIDDFFDYLVDEGVA